MKKSKIVAGILIACGSICLGCGISRYFVETKVQQPAVLQDGVEDLGTGTVYVSPEEDTGVKSSDDADTKSDVKPDEASDESAESESEGGASNEED